MTGVTIEQLVHAALPALDLNPRMLGARRQGPLVSGDMALDRLIRRATRVNAEQHHAGRHVDMALFTMADDCNHHDPCDDEIAAGLDEDLVTIEHERRHPGDSWTSPGYWGRMTATRALFMQAVLLDQLDNAYHGVHDGGVCELSPDGTVCTGCAEDDGEGGDDFGYEPSACHREMNARESYAEFWETQGAEWNRGPKS